jgi:hypothetical protein
MRTLTSIVSLTLVAGWVAACDTGSDADPTGIDVVPNMARGGIPGGGGECCSEVRHPIVVTFGDRSGDSWTSDGGGSYSDSQHTRIWLSDFADPSLRDRFVFIANRETGHAILLDVPGVFTGPCNELDAGVFAPDETPDMYTTPVGWSGVSARGNITCGLARTFPRTRVQILDCLVITHAAADRWLVAADDCQAAVFSVARGGEVTYIGEYPVSYEFMAEEVG